MYLLQVLIRNTARQRGRLHISSDYIVRKEDCIPVPMERMPIAEENASEDEVTECPESEEEDHVTRTTPSKRKKPGK